jgi:DNA-directed RNA polymerase subunit alpha
MYEIQLPSKIYTEDETPVSTKVVIEPCSPGYGVTLANSFRRVLLSSLDGSAPTSFKIKGADHEFTSIPGVKEDVVQIMLNIKKLRVRLNEDGPILISMKVGGKKGEITAGNFEKNAAVEIANPDLHIATLTDSKATFEMEVVIEKGIGYVPVEARDASNLPVGMIVLDALFSPVRKVGYDIQMTRVGQATNFEKVVLTIETDGTIMPGQAFKKAAKILVDHFALCVGDDNQQTL